MKRLSLIALAATAALVVFFILRRDNLPAAVSAGRSDSHPSEIRDQGLGAPHLDDVQSGLVRVGEPRSEISSQPSDPPHASDSNFVRDPKAVDPRQLPEGSLSELQDKQAALQEELNSRSEPILTQRFDDNLVDRVGDYGGKYKLTAQDRSTICAFRGIPGQGFFRSSLPRDQYRDLYELKDTIDHIGAKILALQANEFQSKQKR